MKNKISVDKEMLISIINTAKNEYNAGCFNQTETEYIAEKILDNEYIPVNRCKDCRYYIGKEIDDEGVCRGWGYVKVSANGYCYEAKRKRKETNET